MNKTYNLTSKSFARIFNTKEHNFPFIVKETIKKSNLKYQVVKDRMYEEAILEILKTLDSKKLKASGPHRINDWETGWKENLQEFNKSKHNLNNLMPKFVKKDAYIRFQGNLIETKSNSFETDFVSVLRYYLFSKYYKKINTLYEFGAGTGLNLIAAANIFPELNLVGLDWTNSSIDIINSLKKKLNINISGKRMDLFSPEDNYLLDKNPGILTIGTLEQLGENFKPFVDYLLKNKPQVCIHVETIYELYNPNNLLDYLAINYLEQRNYLRGFLPYLKDLETKKKIKILEVKRTFGSFYHDG